MLIFKNNLYETKSEGIKGDPRNPIEYYEWLQPYNFVRSALVEEYDVVEIIERQPRVYWSGDATNFYPHAYKIGPLDILKKLLSILLAGLENKSGWHQMNAYHFCYLYDVLNRYAYNYNHDSLEEKIKAFPELKGKPIHFELFLKDYFFNTGFLTAQEKYNALSGEQKAQKGLTDPCLFAVINGLLPTREEMELIETHDYPYTIYV